MTFVFFYRFLGIQKSYKRISKEDDIDRVERNLPVKEIHEEKKPETTGIIETIRPHNPVDHNAEDRRAPKSMPLGKQCDFLRYNFTHAWRGLAVLIVYNKFADQNPRKSSVHDTKHMKEIFEALGFKVELFSNKSSGELIQELKSRCSFYLLISKSLGSKMNISSHTCLRQQNILIIL